MGTSVHLLSPLSAPNQEAYVALDMVATEKLQSDEMKPKKPEEESPKVTLTNSCPDVVVVVVVVGSRVNWVMSSAGWDGSEGE